MDELGPVWTCALVVYGIAKTAVSSMPSSYLAESFCRSFTLWVGAWVLEWEKGKAT